MLLKRTSFRWMAATLVIPFLLVAYVAVADAADEARANAADSFKKQVAPIFQKRCLSCHSGDDPKGDFSLLTAESALNGGHIEPGDPAASYLLDLITPANGAAAMPKNADPLTAEEIAAIRDWIKEGATWPDGYRLEDPRVQDFTWWSYQPLSQPAVPALKHAWAKSPIDQFILAKLQEKGLTPSPKADRRTLIRRVTFDLTGLPPTPEGVEAFANDPAPDAYEQLVDRLLESSHYGERWARHWLDVVKYADTHGYDKDKLRPNAWPYRDYVIRSFNEDKPYSQFVQEQIAGDVLFPDKPDGILGLGFIAAGPWDFIGHVEVPESKIDGKVARNLDRDDMVSNTLNTFCSVTVQCARCHNHKFDPITQENYYGLQSLFAAVDRADRPFDTDPQIEQQRIELTSKLTELRKQEAAAAQEIAELGGPRLAELDKKIAELQTQMKVVKEPEFGYHSAIIAKQNSERWVEVDLGKEIDVAQIILRPCHDDFGGIGAGFGFPIRFRVEVAAGDGWQPVLDQTQADYPNPGISPVEIKNVNRATQKVRVTATRLADRKGVFILALAELQVLEADGTNVSVGAKVSSLDSIEAPVRWGRTNLTDGRWARGGDTKVEEQLTQSIQERDAILKPIATPERVARDDGIRKAIQETQGKLNSLPKGQMVFAAATNFAPQANFQPTKGNLRDIRILHRGNIQQPLDPAVPSFLPFNDSDEFQVDAQLNDGERRAALARWLTQKDHPLVWRSIVNRVWQYHFGRGIVATPNDFGKMGELPTHPELLDWLAVEFRDGGQSFKSLHRLIVTSNVYQQVSQENPVNAGIDGSNQFLWRANRRRLEAEEIRDSILAVSGSLDVKMGGPGFYLFALEKTAHSPHYEYHKFDPADTASHRRSIYRFIVRSQPDPWMTTLDCADSSQSTPRRNETLTSLQALSLLNNRFNLVMAERFADRVAKESPDLNGRVERAVTLVLQRPPNTEELEAFSTYAATHGMPNLCRFLFNLSEFVFVD